MPMPSSVTVRVFVVCLLGVSAGARAGTRYVSTAGNDANDGLAWATAKKTVQAGLNVAVSGDQVWVAGGTYVQCITLKDGVALYGGFAGTETDLTQRNWVTNITILDGNRSGSVVTAPSGATPTTRIDGFSIRKGSGTLSGANRYGGGIYCNGSSPTISNNTITGNTVSGYGGGIYCSSSSPTISNNSITCNWAPNGGGIYCCSSSSPTITNNTITGNTASSDGGGIYCSVSYVTINNTIIAFNSSGIYLSGGTRTLRCCCVYGNGAYTYVGPVANPIGTNGNFSADPQLVDAAKANPHLLPTSPCIDAGDDTAVQAGWTDIDGQARVQGTHVDIGADESDGTIWPSAAAIVYVSLSGSDSNDGLSWASAKKTVQAGLNAASSGDQVWVAAGTYVQRITLNLGVVLYGGFAGSETDLSQRNWRTNVTILDGSQAGSVVTAPEGATATTRIDGFTIRNGKASFYGGGICCVSSSLTITNNTITGNTAGSNGGGIYCCSAFSSSPTISNNTITGNRASDGGGIYCASSSSPAIANNTITGNSASYGGGIYFSGSWSTITNTIIAFNSSGIYQPGTSSSLTVRYNCVYGNGTYNYSGLTDPTGTNGNISLDPQLADVARGNPHLQPTSPCVNAGDDTAVPAGWTDVDGQARVQGTHVDIGADESDGTIWLPTPAIVYVSPGGDDSKDGLSWAAAKRTVQAGVDAGGSGSQVWVAAGTYVGTINLRFGMALYGGFTGSETDLSQRNWRTNVTILDGNQAGSVVTAPMAAMASTRIDGFTIRNGKASYGGGIECFGSSPTITNNTISGNTASSSGGGIDCYYSSPTITNNAITGNNTSSYNGGGISCFSSSPTITNNTIAGNTASSDCGGIYCYYSSGTITNNTITGNTASRDGGGIDCYSASPTIASNTIAGNMASYGGGICCNSSSSPAIANNTIAGNTASNSAGGIYCYASSSPTITNTIIAFNSSGVYRSGTSSTPTLRYCCVYGNSSYNYSNMTDPTGTNGNISVNPLFVLTPSAGPDGKWATADDLPADVHLALGSPCINAGDPAYVPAASETDMDGRARKIGIRVDIGADEFCWPGDANCDGYVNVGDLQALVAAWGSQKTPPSSNWNAAADLNNDGYVNVGDLQLLVVHWGENL